ncbi:MAG: hypothetical protein ACKV2T_28770, partial [Kofleriaceae bacterium]
MRHVAVIVLVVFAACDDESSLGIEVFPGPEMRVLEGKTVEHELRLDGERGRTFGFVGDASAMARLAVSTIEHDGGTFLRVTPRCTAVAAGATNSVLAHIEISAPNAAPVTVSVTIEPHESDECAVQVVGWLGPCTDRPPTIEPEIRLDPLTGAEQRICVHVSVPEPIASVDVTFPPWLGLAPLVISGEGLFGLAGPVEADRELVVTGVLGTFRGRRDIDVHWTGGGSARLVVTAGEPGDGVVGARNTLANVAEYKPGILKFATSYYDKPGTVACVRATPKAPTMTLVMRSDLDEIIAQGDLACGVTINAAELVTAMDSADAEEIDVTLERCTPDPLCVHP